MASLAEFIGFIVKVALNVRFPCTTGSQENPVNSTGTVWVFRVTVSSFERVGNAPSLLSETVRGSDLTILGSEKEKTTLNVCFVL